MTSVTPREGLNLWREVRQDRLGCVDAGADACPVRKHHYSARVIHQMEAWGDLALIYRSWGLHLRKYCGWQGMSQLPLD